VIGANLGAAADLFHQAIDKPQTMAVTGAVVGEAYPVVTESDGGLVGRRGLLQGDADRALAIRKGMSIAVGNQLRSDEPQHGDDIEIEHKRFEIAGQSNIAPVSVLKFGITGAQRSQIIADIDR